MRVRWYRRLSVRLAALLVVFIFAFELVSPHLYDAVYRTFGLPPIDAEVYVYEADDEAGTESAFFESGLEIFDEGGVRIADPADPTASDESATTEDADLVAEEFEAEEIPAGAFVMDEDQVRLETWLRWIVYLLVPLVIAVVFAWIISRAVTWRVSRLAGQAATTQIESADTAGALPGPFDARGHDEIAQLATAMNSMRSRATQLLDDLAEKDNAHREWVAQVSHDLRTPLTALIACMDRADTVLAEHGTDELRAQLGDVLVSARSDIDRVHTLAEDLFEVARLESAPQLHREPIPPGELLRQAVRGLKPLAVARGIELQLEIASQLPTIEGDGRLLLRATENLLRNALQHADAQIVASATVSQSSLLLRVLDDGPGFPTQAGGVQPPQAPTATTPRRSDSAGLGLLVAQRVAESHDGHLDVRNAGALGGAQVTIALPI
ncbi:MAG: HAMP domain-containing sensor histidine kinase [Planctomycetota bacterium]